MATLLQTEIGSPKAFIVDGQNVLKHNGGEINLGNIECLRQWSQKNKKDIMIVFPKKRFYQNLFPQSSDVIFINSRIHDDSAILQLAYNLDLPIISNDKYKEFRDLYPDFNFYRVFPFDIVCNVFITRATEFFRLDQENVSNTQSDLLAESI